MKLIILFMLHTANKDPTANMLGDRFAHITGTDTSTFRFVDEILNIKAEDVTEEDGQLSKKGIKYSTLPLFHPNLKGDVRFWFG